MEESKQEIAELEKRIEEVEKYSTKNYFSKKDYIAVALVVLLCLGMVIIGAYL